MFSRQRAIVRTPSPHISEGEVTHIDRLPMDPELAVAQHGDYVQLLRSLGLSIVEAPPAPEHPDGLFVEDALVMIDAFAMITRPGAATRRNEIISIRTVVEKLALRFASIADPATADGGDILVTDRHVFVGQTTRTNSAAIAQFDRVAAPLKRQAVGAVTTGCLHLKSAITCLPDGSLIGVDEWIDVAQFENLGYVVHRAPELTGGDVLCVGNTVVLPSNAPETGVLIRTLGFEVVHINVSELQKIEAGVTCMSVLV